MKASGAREMAVMVGFSNRARGDARVSEGRGRLGSGGNKVITESWIVFRCLVDERRRRVEGLPLWS